MVIGISGKINSGKDLVGQIIQYLTSNYYKSGYEFEYFRQMNKKRNDYPGYLDWQIYKYADKLKDIVCLLIGCTREQLEDRDFKEKELGEEWWYYVHSEMGFRELIPYSKDGYDETKYRGLILFKPTPRILLQQIGTELFRNLVHPNTWVNATMVSYRPFIEGHPNLIKSNGKVLIEGQVYSMGKAVYPNWIITDCRFPNEADAIKQKGGVVIRVNRPCKECDLLNTHKMSCSKNVIEHESETALDDYNFDYIIENNSTIEDLIEKVRSILIKENIL